MKDLNILTFNSSAFWNNHYKNGGHSGGGSYNHLAEFKADIINNLLQEFNIESVIEFGCGDGNVLSLIPYKNYTGIDVSPIIIDRLKKSFQSSPSKTFYTPEQSDCYMAKRYDMSLSLDVIFHLIEDNVFQNYMDDLFKVSEKYVVIYSSNYDALTPWPEFKHRNFTNYVEQHYPNWQMIRFIPNPYPYVEGKEAATSFSDFYIFQKQM